MPDLCRFSLPVRRSVVLPLVVTALVGTGLAGCSNGSQSPAPGPSTYTARVPVIQPGRPGESASTVSPGQTAQRPQEASWNGADLYFVSMMVLHHTQALRMAGLAAGRTSNPQVQGLAERVTAAQAPELRALKAWLVAHKQQVPNSAADAGHAHAGMPGAVTPARLEALARASGPAFDRLWIDLMVAHHAGAVQMAGTVTAAGSDLMVQEIAAEVSVGQGAEIRRMEQVRATL